MLAKATIRVRPSTDDKGQRPEQAQMERAAELLKKSGFEVLRIGRFGLNVQGDEHVFQRELGVDIQGAGSFVKVPSTHHAELSQLIDLVEVAGRPLSFDKS